MLQHSKRDQFNEKKREKNAQVKSEIITYALFLSTFCH